VLISFKLVLDMYKGSCYLLFISIILGSCSIEEESVDSMVKTKATSVNQEFFGEWKGVYNGFYTVDEGGFKINRIGANGTLGSNFIIDDSITNYIYPYHRGSSQAYRLNGDTLYRSFYTREDKFIVEFELDTMRLYATQAWGLNNTKDVMVYVRTKFDPEIIEQLNTYGLNYKAISKTWHYKNIAWYPFDSTEFEPINSFKIDMFDRDGDDVVWCDEFNYDSADVQGSFLLDNQWYNLMGLNDTTMDIQPVIPENITYRYSNKGK